MMTRKQALEKAKEIAELYGAQVTHVKKDGDQWYAYFIEHGERFYCPVDEVDD